jgi:PleD family two-component response regulator
MFALIFLVRLRHTTTLLPTTSRIILLLVLAATLLAAVSGLSMLRIVTLLFNHSHTSEGIAPVHLGSFLSRGVALEHAVHLHPEQRTGCNPSSGIRANSKMTSRATVLVVDDEVVIADTLTIILQQAGFNSMRFHSPEAALETAKIIAPSL